MAKRIRRGTVSIGGAVAGVAVIEWDDAHEFDRSRADDEWSGIPVEMSRQGSGRLTFLEGDISTGYCTSDLVITYTEVTQSSGVESTASKTATFTNVTINAGGSVPAEGRGERRYTFDYSTCTIA